MMRKTALVLFGTLFGVVVGCSNSESNGSKPGATDGDGCHSDGDCSSGEICGNSNGGCFGLARTTRVCWKPECESDVYAGGCGHADSACGSNCACATPCVASKPD